MPAFLTCRVLAGFHCSLICIISGPFLHITKRNGWKARTSRICINQVTPTNHPDLLHDQQNHLELNHARNKRSQSHGKNRSIVRSRRSRDKASRRSRGRSGRGRGSNRRRASLRRSRSLTRSNNRARVRRAQVSRRCSISSFDARVVTSLIGVLVRRSRVVVDDIDRLNIHGERTFGVISLAAGPLDRALGVIWVAAGPDTDADAHGGLGVVCAIDGVGVLERAHDLAIYEPLDAFGGPVD